MRIIAIDPGTKDFGLAYYEDGATEIHQCRMPGTNAEARRKRLAAVVDNLGLLLPGRQYVDALLVEKQFLMAGRSAQFSLAMSAGVIACAMAAGRGVGEWRELWPGGWNHKGKGMAAAARCLTKHEVHLDGAEDAKSALGLLLHYLREIEADITSLALHHHPNLWKELS